MKKGRFQSKCIVSLTELKHFCKKNALITSRFEKGSGRTRCHPHGIKRSLF